MVTIDRHCWHRFLMRHAQLAVRQCDSRDAAHAQVRREPITSSLDALTHMLSQSFHPDLIIHMDESWFTGRPLKVTQKNCAFSRDRPIKPRFLGRQDANHVTLVGAVTLSGSALNPLLLSTHLSLPPEIAGIMHRRRVQVLPDQERVSDRSSNE
jgi:hypothetical protein